MRQLVIAAVAATLSWGVGAAIAQHNHSHSDHSHSASPAPSSAHSEHAAPASDTREFVKFPEKLVEHTLANMRDHLLALQEIQEQLGLGRPDAAAKIAEARLGMSSLSLHGAHDVAKFMPKGMQDAGTAMHRAASQLAIVATDSGVTGDMKPVFSALANVTSACVGCHAGYRFK
ncbi:MAG: hypothetical protein Q8M31_09050 [Beijerinckiaceae bacterium]|nr:hypothetical protein [Beijerinckiaceae bacterium]